MWRFYLFALLACRAPAATKPAPALASPPPFVVAPMTSPATCTLPAPLPSARTVTISAESASGSAPGDKTGTARLAGTGSSAVAWTEDDSIVVTAERGEVSVWRGSDGVAVERLSCGRDTLTVHELAISPDARWIVASGNEHVGPRHGNRSLTCIIDRTTKRARIVGESLVLIGFDARSQLVGGVTGRFAVSGTMVVDLATGKRTDDKSGSGQRLPSDRALVQTRIGAAIRPAIIDRANGKVVRSFLASDVAVASGDGTRVAVLIGGGVEVYDASSGAKVASIAELDGAGAIALSHDGRKLAAWPPSRIDTDQPARLAGPPPPFLAVWDLTKQRQVWRKDGDPMAGWSFTRDGTQLVSPARFGLRRRADTGAMLSRPPGAQFQTRWSNSGHRIVVNDGTSATMWAGDPLRPLYPAQPASARSSRTVAAPRAEPLRPGIPPQPASSTPSRSIVARAADGSVRAVLVGGRPNARALVIESATTCIDLGASISGNPTISFTPDAKQLYMVERHVDGTRQSTRFYAWRTDTGALVRGLEVSGSSDVFAMPAAGRVGFPVSGGLRMYEVTTGAELAFAKAPRMRPARGEPSKPARVFSAPSAHLAHDGPETAPGFEGGPVAEYDARFLIGRMKIGLTIWRLDAPEYSTALSHAWFEPPFAVAVAPDARHVALGTSDGTINLYRFHGERQPPIDNLHKGPIDALVFSPDSSLLASWGRDGIVRVTDPSTGTQIGSVDLGARPVTLLSWAADGRLIIDTTDGSEIIVDVR